jgi:hypothetical protein
MQAATRGRGPAGEAIGAPSRRRSDAISSRAATSGPVSSSRRSAA